jgi:hypothetical protein
VRTDIYAEVLWHILLYTAEGASHKHLSSCTGLSHVLHQPSASLKINFLATFLQSWA